METPIVLIIFNRIDTTQKVFNAIRQAQPKKLLIFGDAPRPNRPEEAQKCTEVRALINQIDWNCEVLTNYSEVNLGARVRLATGLNWVFSQVEKAIIFEHDCLPHPSFFSFCENLLNYYENDERIMHISGNNFQFGHNQTPDSYYFSRHTHIWGWATWRRAWQYYDVEMKWWPKVRDSQLLNWILDDQRQVKYWRNIYQKVYDRLIDTWDYQWTFACWLQNGLSILPRVNLVTNIGFGTEAYHTTDAKNFRANMPRESIDFPLKHPSFVIRHVLADKLTESTVFNPTLDFRIKQKMQRLF